MEFSKELLEKKYEALPKDLKEALDSTEIYESLGQIANKHNLLIDKAAILEEQVSLVLLGVIPSFNFVSSLKKNLEISTDEVNKIATEINDQIFKPFRESLMKIQVSHGGVVGLEEGEEVDREEILKEIEKEDIDDSVGGEEAEHVEIHYADLPDETVNKIAEVKNDSESTNLVEEKLTKPVVSKKEEVEISKEGKIKLAKDYAIDPYREAVE